MVAACCRQAPTDCCPVVVPPSTWYNTRAPPGVLVMKAKVPLTDRAIQSLKPCPAGKRRIVWDALVPGFGVRVTDRGKRSFVLVTRYPGNGNPAPRAIGAYGAMSLEDARTKA